MFRKSLRTEVTLTLLIPVSLVCTVRIPTTIPRLRVADDITQLVGETPMLQLKRLVPAGAADVFAKLEYLNPGGSVKDRAAIGIIRRAEKEGKLEPGGTIVEATAGNTGIGLALIGVNRGYKVTLFVPEKFSEEKVIDHAGPGRRGDPHSGRRGHGRARLPARRNWSPATPRAFMAGQFENPANPDYHYETTAREIFEQMEGQIDALTFGAGTAGTFTGVARFLKERLPKVVAVAGGDRRIGAMEAGRRERTKWKGLGRVLFREL